MRTCPMCGEPKALTEYSKNKRNKNGLSTYCRSCTVLINRKYRKPDSAASKEWLKKNPDYIKDWKLKNPTYHRDYYRKNAELIKEKRRNRYSSNINFRVAHVLRCTIYRYLKNKNVSSTEIIGCDIESFKKHIEGKFKDNMSWDNYGEWHIDHVVPLASGKNYEELVKLNHYSNLQPLWAKDNLSKGKAVF